MDWLSLSLRNWHTFLGMRFYQVVYDCRTDLVVYYETT